MRCLRKYSHGYSYLLVFCLDSKIALMHGRFELFVNIQYFPLRHLRIIYVLNGKLYRMVTNLEHPLSQYADPAFDILSNVSFCKL